MSKENIRSFVNKKTFLIKSWDYVVDHFSAHKSSVIASFGKLQ